MRSGYIEASLDILFQNTTQVSLTQYEHNVLISHADAESSQDGSPSSDPGFRQSE